MSGAKRKVAAGEGIPLPTIAIGPLEVPPSFPKFVGHRFDERKEEMRVYA